MIVRTADGQTSIISDRNLTSVRRGKVPISSEVTAEQFEDIQKQTSRSKKLGPMGSLIEGTSDWGCCDDDSVLDYEKRKKLRELILENPLAYTFSTDPPREAIYSPKPLRIVKQPWQDNDEGVQHIETWQRLFEARKGQDSLMNLAIGAATYFRETGEVLAEVGFLRNKYLNLLGFPNNVMIGRIWLINPTLLEEVEYDRKTGLVKSLTLPGSDGVSTEIKGEALSRFIYFHNRPQNECRGISRLRPLRRWLEGHDDLVEMTMEMHYNDARPIEQHVMGTEGLLPDEVEAEWNAHEKRINDAIDKKIRMIMTSDNVDIKLIGMQGRALQSDGIIQQVKAHIHQGMRLPASFIEAKNANKATIDVQERHYQVSQLGAIDRACALEFLGHVFRKVLTTRNADPRLIPTIAFQPFTSSNALEQAITWNTLVETFGPAMRKQIAEDQGFAYDETILEVKQKTESAMRMRELYLNQNYR